MDRLVAQRGDADALALAHQRDRHPGALPGLPRPGRPLDEEVALLEREHRSRRDRGRVATSGSAPLEDGGERGIVVSRVRVRDARTASARRVCTASPKGRPGVKAVGIGTSSLSTPRRTVTTPCSSSTRRAEALARQRVERPRSRSCAPAAGTSCGRRGSGPQPSAAARPAEARRARCGPRRARPRRAAASGTTPTTGACASRWWYSTSCAEEPARASPSSVPASSRSRSAARSASRSTASSSAAARRRGAPRAGRAAGSRAATRAARASTGSPPRCSARPLARSDSSPVSSHVSKETTASSPPFTSAVRSNP